MSPFSASHCFICITEFGFSKSVISLIAAVSLAFAILSIFMAFLTMSVSILIPRSFITWSIQNSSHTKSGTGKLCSFSCIDISTSTSRLLYSLNVFHFCISCSGKFLVLPPFAFVGLHGTEKYLISAFPSSIFRSVSFSASPTALSDSGSPIYAAHTREHFQPFGEI